MYKTLRVKLECWKELSKIRIDKNYSTIGEAVEECIIYYNCRKNKEI